VQPIQDKTTDANHLFSASAFSSSALIRTKLRKSWKSPSASPFEKFISALLFICAAVSVFTTLGIIFVLFHDAYGFFKDVSVWEFFTGLEWSPLIEPRKFGVLPLVAGTLMIGLGAALFAVPIGATAALFLSEYVKGTTRIVLKSLLEILAGIPSVVYGFFAITFITPHLQSYCDSVEVFNALSAAIVVGIMVIPTISSISQDAFEAVPRELKEAAFGVGARKYQVATTVVFPAALSGFVAAVILAFSRAIGETMAVTLAAGSTPRLTLNPVESIQTMTAYIVQVSLGDAPAGSIEYKSLFAVGLLLFVMTLVTNLIANFVVGRFQEKYQ
jgi:phosphate transport system permease protein